jgi:hypothetical protein
MKVIGLGAPDDVRVRFAACELDVLVDVLREQRANATRDAADTYATTPPGQTRPIDDRHDRLRGLEGLLMQLEEQPHTRPGAVLVGETDLIRSQGAAIRMSSSVRQSVSQSETRPCCRPRRLSGDELPSRHHERRSAALGAAARPLRLLPASIRRAVPRPSGCRLRR